MTRRAAHEATETKSRWGVQSVLSAESKTGRGDVGSASVEA
jgi:hypothetical protein